MRRTLATWALASLIAVAVLYLLADLLRTGPTGSLDVIELAETVPVPSRATITTPSANLRPANTTVHTANEAGESEGDRGPALLDGGDDERGDDGLTPPFETGNDDDDDNDSGDDHDGGKDDH